MPATSASVAGMRACAAALETGRLAQLLLLAGRLNKRQQALLEAAEQAGVPVRRGDATALAVAAPAGLKHQGAAGWLQADSAGPALTDLESLLPTLPDQPLLLVLDGLEDPRNLGACLRSADGAGVDAVLLPRGRGAPLTAVARKTAAGAAESLPLLTVPNLAQALATLRRHGLAVYGLADEADASLYAADLARGCVVVLGNEGQGLRRLSREHCDAVLSLPMLGSVSSLNVSVATGVVLYEARRQRLAALPEGS